MLLEPDLPRYGVSADPVFLRGLLTVLAHQHGGLLNSSALGSSLGVSYHVIQRHLDVLESVFLVRRLAPWFRNVGKRLTKAPKVYIRDTGLLHHLLNISNIDELANHPSRGASWDGFVIEDVLRRERILHPRTRPWFWRTAAGAEIDLLLDRGTGRVAIKIKAGRGDDARALRSLRDSLPDVEAARAWIVDQAPGISSLAPQIARAGFETVINGAPWDAPPSQMRQFDADANRAGHAGLPCNETEAFECLHHLIDARWRDKEVPRDVGLGRRPAEAGHVTRDEPQIFELPLGRLSISALRQARYRLLDHGNEPARGGFDQQTEAIGELDGQALPPIGAGASHLPALELPAKRLRADFPMGHENVVVRR